MTVGNLQQNKKRKKTRYFFFHTKLVYHALWSDWKASSFFSNPKREIKIYITSIYIHAYTLGVYIQQGGGENWAEGIEKWKRGATILSAHIWPHFLERKRENPVLWLDFTFCLASHTQDRQTDFPLGRCHNGDNTRVILWFPRSFYFLFLHGTRLSIPTRGYIECWNWFETSSMTYEIWKRAGIQYLRCWAILRWRTVPNRARRRWRRPGPNRWSTNLQPMRTLSNCASPFAHFAAITIRISQH